MTIDIESTLGQLGFLLQRIDAQLGWNALARAETRVGDDVGFPLQLSSREIIRQDLIDLEARFMHLAIDVRHELQAMTDPGTRADRQRWLRRLGQLEERFGGVWPTERFL